MGGYVRDGVGPPAKTPAKTPSNCHGGLLYISPPLMNLNVPSGWGVTHDVGNARVAPERASSGRGRLGLLRRLPVLWQRKHLQKCPGGSTVLSSPPPSNQTTPNASIVAHDVGNARVAPERASPGHGRRYSPWPTTPMVYGVSIYGKNRELTKLRFAQKK